MGKVKKFFEDIRNAATGACYIGQIVNNCVTNNAKLPLSAAQGKVLMDLYTVLNTKLSNQVKISTSSITQKLTVGQEVGVKIPHTPPSGYTCVCALQVWSYGVSSVVSFQASTNNIIEAFIHPLNSGTATIFAIIMYLKS